MYVGSAQDSSRDQILDEILVGPVPVGVNKFVLQADAPDPSQLQQEDLLGVTVVLVTCSYKEREFVRVGYYVNNEYHDPNAPPVPPVQPQVTTTTTMTTTGGGADGTQSVQEQQPQPPAPPVVVVPNPVPLGHIQRQILADKPRVTKFPIAWGDAETTTGGSQSQSQSEQQQQRPMEFANGDIMTDHDHHNNNNVMMTMTGMASMDQDQHQLSTSHVVSPPAAMAAAAVGGGILVGPGGVVDMQEESNLSHASHFGNAETLAMVGGAGGGPEPMAE